MTSRERPTGDKDTRKETVTHYSDEERATTRTRSDADTLPRPTGEGRSRVRWGAIFAGALVALVVMSVLNILGLAIGAAVVDPATGADGLGIGVGIWWTVSALLALFAGGWTAGHFSQSEVRSDGLMHGVMTWALFVLASFLAVTTTVGQVLGGAFGFIGQNMSAAIAAMQPAEGLQATLMEQGVDQAAIADMEATMIAAGEQATEAIAIGAGWAFVALLLGVLICAFAGSFGTIEPGERGEKRSDRFTSRLRPRRA